MSVTKEEVYELFRDVARRFQETDAQFKATDRKIKEVTTAIGRLGNRLGEFVEEMVRPAAVRLFQARGIVVHQVFPRAYAERDGATRWKSTCWWWSTARTPF